MNHHAYYIEGPLSQFAEYSGALKPFWAKKFERFGIDEARELITFASLKNIGETVFFIGAVSITTEAQQALLKLFEEPQEGTVFILLLPHGALLPTLRSRILEYPREKSGLAVQKVLGGPPFAKAKVAPDIFVQQAPIFLKAQQLAASFLASSQKSRSEMIAKLLKDENDTKERAREFVNTLELALYEGHQMSFKNRRVALEDIAKVRSYLGDRSPSLKMLLEHLALVLPTENPKKE